MVLHLLHTLYGLKQARLAWWRALKLSMEKLRFVSLSSDAGIFLYRGQGSFVIAIIYVDNAIFMGPDCSLAYEMKHRFMKRWETQDLGDVTEFLCMHITWSGSTIHLDQKLTKRQCRSDVECQMPNQPLLLSWPDMYRKLVEALHPWSYKAGSKP